MEKYKCPMCGGIIEDIGDRARDSEGIWWDGVAQESQCPHCEGWLEITPYLEATFDIGKMEDEP